MRIICPHCSHCETDDFEVLDVNRLYANFRCAQCGERFALFVKECSHCEVEQVHVWKSVPSPMGVSALFCEACGRSEDVLHETINGD